MSIKVTFPNSKGDILCGILAEPTPRKSECIVILCHGFATGKDSRTSTSMEKILSQAGIASLRFDFFGHGESEGDLADITVNEAVDDVLSAVRFVRVSGYFQMGLVGSSFGGMAALLAAPHIQELQFLALKSPVSDYLTKIVVEGDSQGHKRRKEKKRGYDAAHKIVVPVLIVHGNKDETVPISQSKKLLNKLPNGHLEIISGADHKFSQTTDFDKMLELLSGFILEQTRLRLMT